MATTIKQVGLALDFLMSNNSGDLRNVGALQSTHSYKGIVN